MSRRLLIALLIASAFFNVMFIVGFFAARPPLENDALADDHMLDRVADQLNLEPDQRAQYESFRADAREQVRSLRDSIFLTRQQLFEAMSREEPDAQEIIRLREELDSRTQELRELSSDTFQRLIEVLTPEQRRMIGRALRDEHEHRPRHDDFRRRMLERFDADRDGRLDETEREHARRMIRDRFEDRRRQFMQQYDVNGDGRIDQQERNAAEEDRRERMSQRRDEMIKQFDADGDGVLNREEQDAARQAWEQRRHRMRDMHPPRPGGPRPGAGGQRPTPASDDAQNQELSPDESTPTTEPRR